MKVLALNSSARTEGQSKTELMLSHLVEGMREAGAEVEIVNLRDKKIKVCVGCFTCWTKTPGQCVHQDDMTEELFSKWLAADVCVYATPLFHHTVNAAMKIFIERTLPIYEPFLLESEDRWVHPLRHKHPAVVVLSVAGFPAMSAFNGLTHYVNFLFGEEKGRLLAEIYRPGAEYMIHADKKRNDILDATKSAGNELVKFRKVSPETLARIEQPFSNNLTDFAEMANCMWRTCIAEGITRKEFEKKDIIPRPDSLKTFMLLLAEGFNPEGAKDTRAVLQYDFSGQVEGSCHFIIANGTINAEIGPAEKPDLIIKTPFDIWVDITTGKADGGQMFMEEKYKAEGDMDLLLNMSKLFGQNH
jgi:multimeric flavodoxin WrbA/putative sterol carrier protein